MINNFFCLSATLMLVWLVEGTTAPPVAAGQEPARPTEKQLLREREQQLLKKGAELERRGQLKEAIPTYEELLSLAEKVYGKDHRNYLLTLRSLARLQFKVGDFDKADKSLREALDGWKKLYGELDSDYIRGLIELARLQPAKGNPERSESFFRLAYRLKSREGKNDAVQAEADRKS